jgi:hypothetical protein
MAKKRWWDVVTVWCFCGGDVVHGSVICAAENVPRFGI